MPVNIQRLVDIILTDAALLALAQVNDRPAIVTAINLKDRERTDHTLRNPEFFYTTYGEVNTRTMLDGWQAVAETDSIVDVFYTRLKNVGLDFAAAQVRAVVDQLISAAAWGAGSTTIGNTLKSLGIYFQSIADQEFQEDVTLANVDAAFVLYDQRELANQVTTRYNEVREAIDVGTVTTWEEARTMLGGV